MNTGNKKIYQFILLIMVFLYFEILLPLSFRILQLDGLVRYLVSLAVVNSLLLFINKICKYFLPFFETNYLHSAWVARVIKIKQFRDDINPLQIAKHDLNKLKKLLFGMGFIYIVSALIYVFICWSIKQLREIINDIKFYKYERTTSTTK